MLTVATPFTPKTRCGCLNGANYQDEALPVDHCSFLLCAEEEKYNAKSEPLFCALDEGVGIRSRRNGLDRNRAVPKRGISRTLLFCLVESARCGLRASIRSPTHTGAADRFGEDCFWSNMACSPGTTPRCVYNTPLFNVFPPHPVRNT